MRPTDPDKALKAQRLAREALARQRAGAIDAAIALYEKALAILPDHYAILTNLGVCLGLVGRGRRALPHLRKANGLKPNDPVIQGALGAALYHTGAFEAAAPLLEAALGRAPHNREATLFLGLALERLGRHAEALTAMERAASGAPPYAAALRELARFYGNAKRRVEEAETARRAWRLEPLRLEPNTRAYFALQCLADWGALPELDRGFLDLLLSDEASASAPPPDAYIGDPFNLLARIEDRRAHRKASERRAKLLIHSHDVREPYRRWPARRDPRRARVGYLSADFHDHATMHLLAGVFRAHDPNRVEIFSYSHGTEQEDAYRRLVIERSAGFRDLSALSARDAARHIHDDGLDLLVDLKGYTRNHRLEIAAYRPARVQATFLGFPGTLGAEFIDYAIVDSTVAPPEHAEDFSEILAYHPICYQPNDPAQTIADPPSDRADWSLPAQATVFCSFNQTYKVDPVRFDSWMAVLRAVDGSVLWLLRERPEIETTLQREAAKRGVAPERLIFADRVAKDRHLERLSHADIALDTRIYNGHTTTIDALLAGRPVIATMGAHFAARVAAGLLRAAGLEELIARTEAEFVEIATALATAPDRRIALRDRIEHAKTVAPLFDPERYTRALETLYLAMIERGPAATSTTREPIRIDAPD